MLDSRVGRQHLLEPVTASCVALIEEVWGSVRLTSSSGRSDAGKNCC